MREKPRPEKATIVIGWSDESADRIECEAYNSVLSSAFSVATKSRNPKNISSSKIAIFQREQCPAFKS
jgi:hypothetical protein